MKFLSVCSGIEAASTAWMPLGWTPVAFSEIENFPKNVLAHHHPDVPNWGDMTKYQEWPDVPIDLLCGGTPCQSFSLAGLRSGLADPRGNLMLTFGAIAAKYRPQWLVWENVPGVLSSNKGRDFGTFLGLLAELGYGFAYRVLDAQYVRVESHPRAVPQRRRRVFVVGHSGGLWQRAAAVLFERESLCGHPAPRREAGKVAPTIPSRSSAGGGLGTDFDCDGGLIQAFGGNNQSGPIDVATARNACASASGRMDFESETFLVQPIAASLDASYARLQGCSGQDSNHGHSHLILEAAHTLRGEGFDASEDGTGRGTPLVPVLAFDTTQITSAANFSNPKPGDACHPLAATAHPPAIAFPANLSGTQSATSEDVSPSLAALNPTAVSHPYTLAIRGRGDGHNLEFRQDGSANAVLTPNGGRGGIGVGAFANSFAVRRLTPLECTRLQGFRDGHTAIEVKGKPAADGPQYKALGNSWAINCARWIGERIDAVNQIETETRT